MSKETVCLIIPPSPFLLDERVFPFLGPLKVAAVLEKAGWPVEVLDLSGYANFVEVVADHVFVSSARFFGITATTPQLPAAVIIAKMIRAKRPDARIIIGGPHATLVVAALRMERKLNRVDRAHRAYQKLRQEFDTIVAGDGEETIFLAVCDDAPELIDGDDRHSPLFLSNERLEETPFPARHLIDIESYHYTIDGVPALSLIAQLGCPYKCGFCAGRNSPMLRNIRMRSTESIVREMELLYRTYGHRGFMLYDDELNVNKEMLGLMHAIAKKQKDLGVKWRLRGFIKSERFTDAQAEAMYEAGFRWILVGFESGSERILDNIKKIATQDDNTRCLDIARRQGLKVKALMSLGHPGESMDTVEETRRWLEDTKPADFDATIITPYPGSPYYDEAMQIVGAGGEQSWVYQVENGDRLYQEDLDYTVVSDYYKGNPDEGYVSHVWTDFLSAEDLVRERDGLERGVRQALNIPFNPGVAAMLYEHSMGQGPLPARILRTS